jgi:DNA-binding response OmpR family regulator
MGRFLWIDGKDLAPLHQELFVQIRSNPEDPPKVSAAHRRGARHCSAVVQMSVLVVEDDPDTAQMLSDFLAVEGFLVRAVRDSAAAGDVLASDGIDCVLLDIMLPGGSGLDLCRRVRERSDVPILFLSARGEDADKLRGLALGADDYIVKSATPAEVVARVKAVLRRGRTIQAGRVLRFGPIEIDRRARLVRAHGQPVPLTAREFDLLVVFGENPRQVLTHDQLFERIWGSWGDRSAVSVYVRKLREKLEQDPAAPELLATVWGVGYRFDPPEPA